MQWPRAQDTHGPHGPRAAAGSLDWCMHVVPVCMYALMYIMCMCVIVVIWCYLTLFVGIFVSTLSYHRSHSFLFAAIPDKLGSHRWQRKARLVEKFLVAVSLSNSCAVTVHGVPSLLIDMCYY